MDITAMVASSETPTTFSDTIVCTRPTFLARRVPTELIAAISSGWVM